ncbi:hypothetical protein BDK61_1476 [Haloarcula quadrata]|uniref:Uncharacterized protein n=1 Tax=Haloarcula quadrata TaxID=182779 RepID=A0A495R538_9EURY|nr:hypothetical protein [Haloarcula quadrata]RKS82176.1 hypothetical protein BDK61_1476 [Haloarcula quadrata]
MTRETPLAPSEFAEAVRDYASNVEDETYLRRCYAGQLVAVGRSAREPLSPVEFSSALVAHAGVELDDVGRERVEYAYLRQLEIARDRAGDGRE